MQGKIRHLLERDGRYFARLVVPIALRPFIAGKCELRTPLGADRRIAIKSLPSAIASIQGQIQAAELRAADAGQTHWPSARYRMSNDQIALRLYNIRLTHDEEVRNSNPYAAKIGIDDLLVSLLVKGKSGSLSDGEMQKLVGAQISYFKTRGNTDVVEGTVEWRALARLICAAEYEALERMDERDNGDFAGKLSHPALVSAAPVDIELQPVSLEGLFDDYIASRKILGKGYGAEKRWAPVFKHLRKELGQDDARSITKPQLVSWRNGLLETRSPRTVSDVWLTAVRTVFSWAVREDRLPSNVSLEVRQEKPKKQSLREKGYTDDEAQKLLAHSLSYTATSSMELPQTVAAKQWIPILCAHTGARVSEMTQLRKKDLRTEGGRLIARIAPDAGTVKTGQFRDVPLHRQIVDLGFHAFVNAAPEGPLFYMSSNEAGQLSKARMISGRISEWLNKNNLVPVGVSPSHGWRHRFKTVGREIGCSDRVLDAICGHAGRTAGDAYGDVSITAKAVTIDKFPAYRLQQGE